MSDEQHHERNGMFEHRREPPEQEGATGFRHLNAVVCRQT